MSCRSNLCTGSEKDGQKNVFPAYAAYEAVSKKPAVSGSMKLSMAAKKLNKVCQSDKAADIFL